MTDAAQEALRILRDGSQFQWYVIPLFALVIYVYAVEVERKNWNLVLAGLAALGYVLPNLWALNFVIEGLLGEGVASQARFDPQAKALGEWLRSRHVDIPEVLL